MFLFKENIPEFWLCVVFLFQNFSSFHSIASSNFLSKSAHFMPLITRRTKKLLVGVIVKNRVSNNAH